MQPPLTQEGAVFATTCWTVVLSAQDGGNQQAGEALARLCQTYWPPLFAFLRRQGYAPPDAEDLVQGFFERFLAHDYLQDVAREKGRFRSFLLKSLQHFAANWRRDQRTQRRGGSLTHVTLNDPEVLERCEAAQSASWPAEFIFDRVWAATVMESAARRLRNEFERGGKLLLYESIRGWLANEAKPGAYAVLAPQVGLSEGALAVAVHRMRLRFNQFVREEVSHTVQSPAEIDDEMRHLLRVLTTDA